MLRDPRSDALATQFRRAVAVPSRHQCQVTQSAPVPRLRLESAARRSSAKRRYFWKCVSRRPQRGRPASRKLHVHERAARKALRHAKRVGQRFPARDASGGQPATRTWPARPLSILTITSYANRTSPVLRGKYVLGESSGRAAAAAAAQHPGAGDRKQGFRQDSSDEGGDGCSIARTPRARAVMPPWTRSALRSIISMRWDDGARSMPPVTKIDPSGVLPDGTRFEGVAGLQRVLAEPAGAAS